ncbi:hypothetical protein B0H11DRAFT_2235013 [Mycena galericulata]|nr:hypothetical protein B0H11DRAFT_2235013 [Mycena galericulata]
MDEEEEAAQREHTAKLDKRIRRWLKYCVRRLRKEVGTRLDPAKILGPSFGAALGIQDDHCANDPGEVGCTCSTTAATSRRRRSPTAPFRAEIARALFTELPEAERVEYGKRAKAEAAETREAYERGLKEEPSKSPEARQKYVKVAPILEGIYKRTGLHSVIIMGGPIPKFGGDLRTV